MKKLAIALLIFIFNSINCASRLSIVVKCLNTRALRNITTPVNTQLFCKQNICTSNNNLLPARWSQNPTISQFKINNQKHLIYCPTRLLNTQEISKIAVKGSGKDSYQQSLINNPKPQLFHATETDTDSGNSDSSDSSNDSSDSSGYNSYNMDEDSQRYYDEFCE